MNHYSIKPLLWVALAAVAMAQVPPPALPALAAPTAPPQAATAPAPPAPPQDKDKEKEKIKVRAATAPRVVVSGFGSGSYLGVYLSDVSKERLGALKLTQETGAEITMIDQDSPAAKAGLKEHDVILSFNGQKVESVEQIKRMIHETPAGRSVALSISREGKPMSMTAQLADRGVMERSFSGPGRIVIPPIPPINVEIPDIQVFTTRTSTGRIGAILESLTPQLGEFFGVTNGQGLLVRSVEKGSPAEAAGLKAGDVITRVQNQRITDLSDWHSAMREHNTGAVSLTIVRDKREQTISVKLPEPRGQLFDGTTLYLEGLDRLADLGPEIEAAARNALEQSTRLATQSTGVAVERANREVERAMRQAQQNMERNVRRQEQERERQERELQRELERQQRDRETRPPQ